MRFAEKNTKNWRRLLMLGLLVYTLGVWGYFLHLRPSGGTLFDAAYRTFLLFQMRYDGLGQLPWQLELARFLAPVVMLVALGKVALSFLRAQWAEVRIRWLWSAHHVVIGSGLSARTLVEDISRQGEKVILLSDKLEDLADDSLWGSNSVVMQRLAYGDETWQALRLDRARTLTVLTEDDELNLEIIRKTKQWSADERQEGEGQLQAFCRFSDNRIRQLLRDQSSFFSSQRQIAVSAFNPYQRAARDILKNHPLEGKAQGVGRNFQPHALITGTGILAENIVFWVAMTAHYGNDVKARISLFDSRAAEFREKLCRTYPALETLVDLVVVIDDPESPRGDWTSVQHSSFPFSCAYFCGASGAGNLLAANKLGAMLDRCEKLVVFEQHAQFARLLRNDSEQSLAGAPPIIFDFNEHVCTKTAVMQESLDNFARFVADRYYRQATESWGMQKGETSAIYPWSELSEEWRDANRTQYDHLGIKLRTIGAEEVETADAEPDFAFTGQEIELLARMEHCRWAAQRMMYGWTFAPNRSDQNRRHPELVRWDQLVEKTRQKDRDAVTEIPKILAELGRGIRRAPSNKQA